MKRWLIISNDDLELEYQYKKNIKLDENILDVGEFTKYKNMFGDTKDIKLKTEYERVKGKIVIGKEFERTQEYIDIVKKQKGQKQEDLEEIYKFGRHVKLQFQQKPIKEGDLHPEKQILFSFKETKKPGNIPKLFYVISMVYPYPYGIGAQVNVFDGSLISLRGDWQFKDYLKDTTLPDTKIKAVKIDLQNLFPKMYKEFAKNDTNNSLIINTHKSRGRSMSKKTKGKSTEIYKLDEKGTIKCNLTGIIVPQKMEKGKGKCNDEFIKIEWDHRIPNMRAGPTIDWNFQPTIKYINQLKGKICQDCEGDCHTCVLALPEVNSFIKNENIPEDVRCSLEKLFSKCAAKFKDNNKSDESNEYFKKVATYLPKCIDLKKKGDCTIKMLHECPNKCGVLKESKKTLDSLKQPKSS